MMPTHADGYFAIGKTHTVCEDYVRCGRTTDGMAYTIVSDGCSASKDVDIGARLLVRAAEIYILSQTTPFHPVIFGVIAELALGFATTLNLHPTCLDATLIIAIETDTHVAVYKMGDGVIASRRRDGSMFYDYQEFVSGAPYYPNYLRDAERHKSFRDMPGNDVIFTTGSVSERGVGETKETWNMHDYAMVLSLPILFHKKDVDLVVLMTDGACSFRKGLEPVPVVEIVKQILEVKSSTGEFMIRRAKRFLGTYCTNQGWHHDDDFGVGAIFIDEEVTP
jgi:hypothetical protein